MADKQPATKDLVQATGALEGDTLRPTGINHLLVMAIDEYAHCPKLSNCVDDARDLIEVLTHKYRFDPANITTYFNEAATEKNITEILRNLRDKVKEEDSLVIYFSGHGEIDDDIGFWVPVEANVGEYHQFIHTDIIRRYLDKINSFHTFMIVDACFSGALFSTFRSTSYGYENRKSRWGLSASHSKERALDGQPGDNSPFAKSLLFELKNNKDSIGVQKLAANVIDRVQRATQGRQTPVFKPLDVKGDDSGQFIFHPRAENTFVDPRDGQVYRTVKINGLTWLAENLNYEVDHSLAFKNNFLYASRFGRLYTWEAAQKACPEGWRLPTKKEYQDLLKTYREKDKDKERSAYRALIEGGKSGFHALLSGYSDKDGGFHELENYGHYWSSDEKDKDNAWYCRFSHYSGKAGLGSSLKSGARSVRCVRN